MGPGQPPRRNKYQPLRPEKIAAREVTARQQEKQDREQQRDDGSQRNKYQPLRDLEKKTERAVPQQQVKPSSELKREDPPKREDRALTTSMPGGPPTGHMVDHVSYANEQVRANNAARQASLGTETTPPRQRTPIKELVKKSADRAQETTDPKIDRGPEKSKEIER